MGKFKKSIKIATGFSVLIASAIAFQNCSGYQVYDLEGLQDLSSACGEGCAQTINGLNLKTSNTYITLVGADLNPPLVDIAGYCDDADFPQSEIVYQFFDGGNPLSSFAQSTGVGCDEQGRFHFQAVVPPVSSRRALTLRVTLTIPGQNPSTIPAAQKQITVEITP